MTQYSIWIGYRLPSNPDMASEALKLEADALQNRNVELQACSNGSNPYQCRRDAEIAFRERIRAIPSARFYLNYSGQSRTSLTSYSLDLEQEWAAYPELDQNLGNLQPNKVFETGLAVDTWTKQFIRSQDNQAISLPSDLADAILASLPRQKTGPTIFGAPLSSAARPRLAGYALGVLAILTLLAPLDVGVLLDTNYLPSSAYIGIDWIPASYYFLANTQTWAFSTVFQQGTYFVDSMLSSMSLAFTLAAVVLYALNRRRVGGALLLLSVLAIFTDYVYDISLSPGYLVIPAALLLQLGLGAASVSKPLGRANFGSAVGKSALGTFLAAFAVLLEYFSIMDGVLTLLVLAVVILVGGFYATTKGARELASL